MAFRSHRHILYHESKTATPSPNSALKGSRTPEPIFSDLSWDIPEAETVDSYLESRNLEL